MPGNAVPFLDPNKLAAKGTQASVIKASREPAARIGPQLLVTLRPSLLFPSSQQQTDDVLVPSTGLVRMWKPSALLSAPAASPQDLPGWDRCGFSPVNESPGRDIVTQSNHVD